MKEAAGIITNTSDNKPYTPEPLLVLGYKALLYHIISNFQPYSFTHSKFIDMDSFLQSQYNNLIQALGSSNTESFKKDIKSYSKIFLTTGFLMKRLCSLKKYVKQSGAWGDEFQSSYKSLIKHLENFINVQTPISDEKLENEFLIQKKNLRRKVRETDNYKRGNRFPDSDTFCQFLDRIIVSLEEIEHILVYDRDHQLHKASLDILR
ncbi:MAG: hypothetical protein MI974_20315 [Chitinophagales bacterium]|nr:hypothetical protein [Chitinophagales bacterium]